MKYILITTIVAIALVSVYLFCNDCSDQSSPITNTTHAPPSHITKETTIAEHSPLTVPPESGVEQAQVAIATPTFNQTLQNTHMQTSPILDDTLLTTLKKQLSTPNSELFALQIDLAQISTLKSGDVLNFVLDSNSHLDIIINSTQQMNEGLLVNGYIEGLGPEYAAIAVLGEDYAYGEIMSETTTYKLESLAGMQPIVIALAASDIVSNQNDTEFLHNNTEESNHEKTHH
ncbi:hypothetical protein [Echinimonas agarilytica]|uniref:Uncharacterized protein n=1 Tax=Echinimonas agarilytica TaxID=1215918 RepID=A0AA41W5Y5_9GAMM|nr:hypothetical protein [Echinimonas agarilytica]MCM2679323.1 hypothetical protein [Echinimonas agarilytica]